MTDERALRDTDRFRWMVVLALCIWPLAAQAQGTAGDRTPAAAPAETAAESREKGKEATLPEEKENRFAVGAIGSGFGVFGGETVKSSYGGGVFLEVALVPRQLSLELAARVLSTSGDVAVPIDLLVKKPFHVNRWFEPFIGLGPTVVPLIKKESTELEVGGAAVVGAYFWLTRHVGLTAIVHYNLVYNVSAKELEHELGGSGGVVFGF